MFYELRMKNFRRIFIYLLIVLILWIPLAWAAANYLIIEKRLAQADAILILGGSSTYIERTQKAAELYKQGVAPRILLSNDGTRAGWSRIEERNPYFVELARKKLIEQGVAPDAIEVLQPPTSGTIDEARNLRVKIGGIGWKRVLIVTSAYHTRRALWTFEKVLAESDVKTEVGIVSAPVGQQTPTPPYWWLTIRGWDVVAAEYVKSLYYWVYY
jgi:uncharacterized SAM-binding protein YcdF (DUF218 family)